jgi:hypothetical protein
MKNAFRFLPANRIKRILKRSFLFLLSLCVFFAPALPAFAAFTATGGTVTTPGDGYTYHVFTASGTFTVSAGSNNVEVLVVAGGGGGATAITVNGAGGGGAGGLVSATSYAVSTGSYTVTVGAGGATATVGNDSVFDTITALAGGAGGITSTIGGNGGSAGGGGGNAAGGTATQGNSGGGTGFGNNGGAGSTRSGGGGGGANAVGSNANGPTNAGGAGGAGKVYWDGTGAAATYAGGGGGKGGTSSGSGGAGGGGAGNSAGAGTPGTANTGGGGGGGQSGTTNIGGSGIVIVRYLPPSNPSTLAQASYKWFSNANSADVGRGAIMNQPMIAPPQGTPFRLRLLLSAGNSTIAQSGTTSLLQFAVRSGTCDTAFSGESYSNVSSTTGAIRYYDNATPADGASLVANYEDPRFASSTGTGIGYDIVRNQAYSEGSNNFSNTVAAIAAGEDGLWDFALVDNSATRGTSYCFRAVQAGGTPLNSYYVIPEIQTYQPMKIKLRGNVKLRQVKLH